MNYRHRFHAGNAGDVFKHAVLCRLLAALAAKPAPFCVIDTHAGSGRYPLTPGGEWERGIGRLWPRRASLPDLAGYFGVIEATCPGRPKEGSGGRLQAYPGSPLIIAHHLRGQDRAALSEREPSECLRLRQVTQGFHRVAVREGCGLAALRGLLPPAEPRGLILIDPPYERAGDFEAGVEALGLMHRRFRQGQALLWYPIKRRSEVTGWHRCLRALARPVTILELLTLPEDVEGRFCGSGLVLVNPPWGFLEGVEAWLRPLAEVMAGDQGQPLVRRFDPA